MVEAEAAQRGILQAILSLHADGTLTDLLDDFYASVLPKYFALNSPIVKELVFGEPSEPVPIGSYARSSRDRRQRQAEYEDALQQWARRFRLTRDLKETGECLPWVLDFGRRSCERRSFSIAPERRAGERQTAPWGLPIDGPKPEEKFSEWLARIRPALRKWYSAQREKQRSRSYPDPAKRNPNHYRWFVLKVCGGMAPGKILEVLEMRRGDESTIRKGIMSIRGALGLSRK